MPGRLRYDLFWFWLPVLDLGILRRRGAVLGSQLGDPFGEIVHPFQVFHDFRFEAEGDKAFRLIGGQPEGEMLFCIGGQAVDFGLGVHHFASDGQIGIHQGANRTLHAPVDLVMKCVQHFLGRLR